MTTVKHLYDRFSPADARRQCRRHAACHRQDGHDGDCATLGVVIAKRVAGWVRGLWR